MKDDEKSLLATSEFVDEIIEEILKTRAMLTPAEAALIAPNIVRTTLRHLFSLKRRRLKSHELSQGEEIDQESVQKSEYSHLDLVGELLEGETYAEREMEEAERQSVESGFARRREILAAAMTASEVSQNLGVSLRSISDRTRRGWLLALKENGRFLYPVWQFDPGGPDGLVEGLPEVIRALDLPTFSKMLWLTRPHPVLDSQTPLNMLKCGKRERVLDLAHGVGVA